MSDSSSEKGGCLCGAVRVAAKAVSHKVGACHCGMCRKWTGGPLLAVDCGTDVSFEGEENIKTYNSSDWAERGFCDQCGSHLFYRLKSNQQYIMPVGLFDECKELEFDRQIFIESKPEYYSFANKTRNMTGEEVFAQFSPSSDE